MIKILVVVPYDELYQQVESYVGTLDEPELTIDLHHIVGTGSQELQAIVDRGYDIVVARGITARALARSDASLHVVEISISASDLVSALWRCREGYGDKGVGIVVTDPSIFDSSMIYDLTGIPIHLRQAEDQEHVYESIRELAAMGVRTFVGGLTLCRKCESLGYLGVHIKTGEAAMTKALNEAVAAGRSLNRERTRANLVTTLLNNTEDVMFVVNRSGQIVAANVQAAQLLLQDRHASLEGRLIEELYPSSRWTETLKTQVESEVLETLYGQLTLVAKSPIMVDEQSVGVLFTCRNVEALRETEHKIRKEMSKKGLVAHYRFSNIISENPKMKMLIATAYKYSQVDSNVFIIGETGTGKELFAQSIHNASKRASQPFVAVNCAALPEPLLESELFGYTEGAFSGAVKGGKMGLFELAHKGTLFLDEIGEMPLRLQAKILRVLQEKEIRKIGGDTVVPVDVRIISATNINILDRIQIGQFREDLYYRINLLNLKIPPLRQRPEDIEVVFRHFVQRYSTEAGKPVPRIEPEVIELMKGFSWLGNIRELRNFSERMAILNESGVIGTSEVENFYLFDDRSHAQDHLIGHHGRTASPYTSAQSDQRELPLSRQLEQSGLDRDAFARRIGVSRTTLWRRLREEQARNQGGV